MKKILLSAIMIAICTSGFAATVNEMLKKYSAVEDANVTNIDGKMLEAASKNGNEATAGLKELYVIELNSCSAKVKQEFATDMKSIKDESYTPVVKSNKDGEKALILTNNDNGSMVIFAINNGNYAIVKILGSLNGLSLDKILKNL